MKMLTLEMTQTKEQRWVSVNPRLTTEDLLGSKILEWGNRVFKREERCGKENDVQRVAGVGLALGRRQVVFEKRIRSLRGRSWAVWRAERVLATPHVGKNRVALIGRSGTNE